MEGLVGDVRQAARALIGNTEAAAFFSALAPLTCASASDLAVYVAPCLSLRILNRRELRARRSLLSIRLATD